MNKKEFFKEIDLLIQNYINKKHKEFPLTYKSGRELEKIINPINFSKKNYKEILQQIQFYIEHSIQSSHPHFNNQLYAGDSEMGLVGEIVSYLTNNSMVTFEVSPVANILEQKVIQKINSLIGFKNADGIMVPGGSNANLLALHCARNEYNPENKEQGNMGKPFVVFVSEDAHYSFEKAMNLLGLGQQNLIKITTLLNGKMSLKDLENKIKEALGAGKIPLFITSTAGTTIHGAFDDILKINALAKKYKIWHHVDAAWGGPALFSKKMKGKLKEINKVDSVAWDAHKLMGVGLVTSFILLKKKNILERTNSSGGDRYIFHNYENTPYDTGHKSLQCGRKNDILKLWLSWQYNGDSGYENFIDTQRKKTLYLQKKIKKSKDFKLIKNSEYLNVCFQLLPKNKKDNVNTYNKKMRFLLIQETSHMVNIAQSGDDIFFRYTFANNNTQESDIDDFIEKLLLLKKQH